MILLFAGMYYYPHGGVEDLVGSYGVPDGHIDIALAQAMITLNTLEDAQWAHAYDTERDRIVKAWVRDEPWAKDLWEDHDDLDD